MVLRIFLPLAVLLLATPLAAQGLGTSALRGLDRNAPIDVDADRIEVLDDQQQALFSGNVRVRQSSLTLESNRIKIAYSRQGDDDPEIQRLDADGDVRLATPSERATARFGIYDVERRILTLIGNVELMQGSTKVQGNRLVINLESGRTTLDGSSAGGQAGGRVTGRFTVPQKQ